MNILGFDTCLDKMYVCAKFNNQILPSKIIQTTKEHYHSAFLISTIRDLLRENHLIPQDIDAIAVNTGPGSFTGIRACTTVARILGQSIGRSKNIKTIGVSSLEILSKINEGSGPVIVALDARKETAYAAIFEKENQILSPRAILIKELQKILAEKDYFIVTDDSLEPILGGLSYQKQNKDLGKYLIEAAVKKINENSESDWKNLHPLYIHPPAVTVLKTAENKIIKEVLFKFKT